jgi:heme exporter protein D
VALSAVLGCLSASFVDAWAAKNWRLFTRQNYFGRGGGVFVAVVYALPMVLNSLLILVNFVREIARLLIRVKREELRRAQAKAAKRVDAAAEPKKTK